MKPFLLPLSDGARRVCLRGLRVAATAPLFLWLAAALWLSSTIVHVPVATAQERDADPQTAGGELFSEGNVGAQATAKPVASNTPVGGIPMTLSKMFKAGGIIMYPIVLCSIIMFWFSFERMVVLRRRRVIPRDFVKRFLEHLERGELDRASALQLCEENGSPAAEVFSHGVRKWGKPAVEVEQAIIDGGERQVSQLRKHLRIINSIATVSPLLGLLGTVFGMITCFNEVANSSGMGKSEQLAGGISEALITTASGLLVAIPSLVVYMYFAGQVDGLVMEMDSLAQKVVNYISAEGIAAQHAGLPRIARPKTIGTSAIKNS
jgi:biopolymer transport protein ExbB